MSPQSRGVSVAVGAAVGIFVARVRFGPSTDGVLTRLSSSLPFAVLAFVVVISLYRFTAGNR